MCVPAVVPALAAAVVVVVVDVGYAHAHSFVCISLASKGDPFPLLCCFRLIQTHKPHKEEVLPDVYEGAAHEIACEQVIQRLSHTPDRGAAAQQRDPLFTLVSASARTMGRLSTARLEQVESSFRAKTHCVRAHIGLQRLYFANIFSSHPN